jgi:hypothetical protein
LFRRPLAQAATIPQTAQRTARISNDEECIGGNGKIEKGPLLSDRSDASRSESVPRSLRDKGAPDP